LRGRRAVTCSIPPSALRTSTRAQWGGYTDRYSGFVLLTHRYYDPQTGRFVTRDPIGQAGGINEYGYVGGDPVNWGDPDGLMAKEAAVAVTVLAPLPVVGEFVVVGAGVVLVGVTVYYGAEALWDWWHRPRPATAPNCQVMPTAPTSNPRNWATEKAKVIAQAQKTDPCTVLTTMMAAETDSQKREAIKKAMKFLGCDGTRYQRGGSKR
jgi:RHS repeat-associated protein